MKLNNCGCQTSFSNPTLKFCCLPFKNVPFKSPFKIIKILNKHFIDNLSLTIILTLNYLPCFKTKIFIVLPQKNKSIFNQRILSCFFFVRVYVCIKMTAWLSIHNVLLFFNHNSNTTAQSCSKA